MIGDAPLADLKTDPFAVRGFKKVSPAGRECESSDMVSFGFAQDRLLTTTLSTSSGVDFVITMGIASLQPFYPTRGYFSPPKP